jgi:hypothetical protein
VLLLLLLLLLLLIEEEEEFVSEYDEIGLFFLKKLINKKIIYIYIYKYTYLMVLYN